MRRLFSATNIFLAAALAIALFSGCSSNKNNATGSNGQEIKLNHVPAAVNAAFDAEHPYAVMNHPREVRDEHGVTAYIIPYTRSDGTTGQARYSPMGELLNDK